MTFIWIWTSPERWFSPQLGRQWLSLFLAVEGIGCGRRGLTYTQENSDVEARVEMNVYFMGSVLLLAVLLYFPVTRIVWVLSVRRLQRKLNAELSQAELKGQLNRARLISIALVLIFSYLFNFKVGDVPVYG